MRNDVTVTDLAGVVYSCGRAFDGLTTGRLDTGEFLRTGNTAGITSRADLALLKDLRDAAQFILTNDSAAIDAHFLCSLNRQISRSELRRSEQHIGVSTPLGRHTPPALDEETLEGLIQRALTTDADDVVENALTLFVDVARAQPFEDGNKRTALFAANSLLLRSNQLIVIPDDTTTFNLHLAHAYLHHDDKGVKEMLRTEGIIPIGTEC
jgi:prophage maintenance system killer protein